MTRSLSLWTFAWLLTLLGQGFGGLALPVSAESTRFWEQSSYADFEKGTLEGLSLRNDGSLRLGPRFDLVRETDSGTLWGLAKDSRGNLFVAGGSPGRVYKVPPGDTASGADSSAAQVFFEARELEIHALAVDRQDRIYAATAPDGVIYRITPQGEASVFYEPKTKYIWALAFDSKENLYVATGDKGEIYRVDPAGQARLFFSGGAAHIRSLLVDAEDNLYAGTDAQGMILRIRPDGEAFVLYESPKKEVTALALDAQGNLYAAAVGDKPLIPGQPPRPFPGQLPGMMPMPPAQPPVAIPTLATANLAGGSEVYRIAPDGLPQRVWASREEIVYSLAVRPGGGLLIGTGNRGRLFQLDALGQHTYLARSPSMQITALLAGKDEVLVATSNGGRLYRLGADFTAQGSFVSDVFDAGRFSSWGSILAEHEQPPETSIRFETRSGNASSPELHWSPWSEAKAEGHEAFSASPPARFFQWRAVLSASQAGRTPALSSVQVAYLPKNIAPVIEEVQNTPQGYRFPPQPVAAPQPQTLVLPPLGFQGVFPAQAQPRAPIPANLTAEQGYVGVRWFAYDENDDALRFAVYVRGTEETEWKLLKDGLSEMAYSWDSSNWPDGTYAVRIVASDVPSNPAGEALSASREGPTFEIDNTPPEILDLKAVPEANRWKVSFRASDRRSTLQTAEYSLDGGPWRKVFPVTRLSDAREEQYQFETEEVSGSEHTVVVRVFDRFQNMQAAKVVVSLPAPGSR